ncbi:MAG: hypothetical protein ABSA26_06295 [Thermoguttaceae bacterium]
MDATVTLTMAASNGRFRISEKNTPQTMYNQAPMQAMASVSQIRISQIVTYFSMGNRPPARHNAKMPNTANIAKVLRNARAIFPQKTCIAVAGNER